MNMVSAYSRRRRLGAISPEDAVNSVFPKTKVRSTAGFTQQVWDNILASVNAGQIVGLPSSQCAGQTPGMSNVQLTQVASGLALTGTVVGLETSGAVAAATLAPWTMGISALIGIFPLVFAHHAQAVKQEQQVECAAVPAANNTLQIILQGVQSGQFTPQHGIDALASLVSDFESAINSIVKRDNSHCNAGCVWEECLEAIAAEMTSQFQDLAANPAAPATPASASQILTPGSGATSVINVGPLPLTMPNVVSSVLPAPVSASGSGAGLLALLALGILAVVL